MRWLFYIPLILLAGCGRGEPDCSYDHDAMMALDYRAFDQDLPRGGWRGVGRDERCASTAADLIAAWREHNGDDLQSWQSRMLGWHEGQMRANAGEYDLAASLFDGARHQDPTDGYEEAWNLYADASSAFVRRDRDTLETAYREMLALPEPDDWQEFAEETEKLMGRLPRWPNNVEVVERLLNCFDAPYAEAYGKDCEKR